jgi:hypothetical protein
LNKKHERDLLLNTEKNLKEEMEELRKEIEPLMRTVRK